MALVRVVEDDYLVGAIAKSKLPPIDSEITSHRREFQSQKKVLVTRVSIPQKTAFMGYEMVLHDLVVEQSFLVFETCD